MERKAVVTKGQKVARAGTMAGLIAVLTVTALPLPPPLSTITLAPVAIFVSAIFLGPWVGFVASVVGSGVGFVVATQLGTISIAVFGPVASAVFPIFLIGIIVARGPEGALIGWLRKWSEIGSMIVGTIFETLVFFVIDYFYTYPFILIAAFGLPPDTTNVGSLACYTVGPCLDFGTLVDLVYLPPAMAVLYYLRKRFGVPYLDEVKPVVTRPAQATTSPEIP